MKNLYKIVLFLLFLVVCNNTFSQYTLKVRFNTFGQTAGSRDCDWSGDSDFQMELSQWDPDNLLGVGSWETKNKEWSNDNGAYTKIDLDEQAGDGMNPQNTGCHDVEWRAFEDDPVGSDANTGWQNICINFPTLIKDNTWRALITVGATVNDGDCNNGGNVTYTSNIQYLVSGTNNAPANDYFCDADANATYNFGTVSYTQNPSKTGTTNNANTQRPDAGCVAEPNVDCNDRTVWYKFSTPVSAASMPSSYKLSIGSSSINPFVQIYRLDGGANAGASHPSCATLSSFNFQNLAKIGDFGNSVGTNADGQFCLQANKTYYIQVDGYDINQSGNFTLTIDGRNAPIVDQCSASAVDLGTLNAGATIGDANGTNRYNNFCANATGDPNPGWGTGAPFKPVWFKFTTTATSGRDVDFEAYNDPASLGDQINLRLALYEGCGGTKIFAEGTQPLYGESVNVKCLAPSTTYYLMVDGWDNLVGGGEGYFGLTVKDNGPYPANDLICNATNITVQTAYTYNSQTLSSENNIRGTNCSDPQPNWTAEVCQDNDAGVWYKFGQVPGRSIVVDANDNGSDDISIQMALYSTTTNDCNATKTLVQTENSIASNDEDAYFSCLNPNLYYWLLVDGGDYDPTCLGIAAALEEGDFSLRFWFPEEGETTFCNAEDLGSVPDGGSIYARNLSNLCGVSSFSNASAPSAFGFDKAVVYKFTTPPAVGFTDASVNIEAFSNPYYDDATHEVLGGAGGNMNSLENGWMAGDEIDLQLALYSDGACASSHYVVGSYYDPTVGGPDPTGLLGSDENLIVSCLKPNTVYYLVVDGGTNTNGYYDIRISDYGKHTPNDLLCQAIDLSATNSAPWTNCNSNTVVQLLGQNNYCATTTNDIPASLGERPPGWGELNSPVWYKFKAPKSGKLKIEAINTISDLIPPYDEPEISAQLAVFFLPGGYQGTCANLSTEKDRLVHIGSNHDALLHDEEYTIECLMPDSIYYLLVDGSSETLCPTCTRGEFYLKLTSDPRDRPATNDLPCDAIDLGTPAVWTNPTIYDTRVSPASGASSYPSPTTGYPSATGLHNGVRNNAGSCMRVENNYCAGIAGEPAVNGGNFFTDFSPDGTVWYKFTAPSTGEVKINTISDPDNRGDLLYTQIGVFETSDNTCTGTMVGIAADGLPDNVDGDNELTVKCLDPGKTYFLMVDGAGLNKRGYFELQIQAVPQTLTGPANDDICNATPVTYPASIGSTTTVNNQTNRCATIQTIYSEPTTFTKDADVWYKFTTPNTPAPHAVEVEVTSGLPWPFGDAMDPQIALYKMNPTGGPCASSFTLVDDGYSAVGLPFYESFEFHCLEQNTTYYLMVDGSGLNEQGNFKVDVTRINPHPLPTNDNICQVGTTPANGYLDVLGGTVGNKVGNTSTNWHNFCSDVETGEAALMTDGNYTLDQTVWFHFRTPNVANNIDVEIRALNDPNNVGDQIDLQMLLVQGNPGCSPTAFTTLTPIESVDPALTFNATMNVCLPPNTDFYIQVDGSGLNKQGYFTVEVENMGTTSAPANDKICNAKTLTVTGTYSGYTNDNNICATLESNEKQQVAGSIQRSVWYKFVAPTSADVFIEVKGNSWFPFTQNYFLPDITIWELSDNTYASIDNTIAGCATPSASNWNQLEFNDYQGIPNSLANGVYPTVVLTPQCLKPGYTYYVQVDGTAGIGLDGYFSIQIKNNQPSYSGPSNNEASGATTVPISSASCQYSNGTWQTSGAGYTFGTNPTWSNPNLIGIANSSGIPSCTQNCGDVWFKFQMPAACGNNTKSFIKIEGDDEFDLDLSGYPELAIAAYNGGSTTSTSNLTFLKCSVGGTGVDPDFSISANPGDYIYLQVWDLAGNEQNKHFKLCVSEQKSADDCVDATNMTLDVPYCWSVESHTGETPSSSVVGSGLYTCFNDGNPKHSSYFKFTTDPIGTFCDDYYIYVNTSALAKAMPAGANHACTSGTTSSVEFNMALWKVEAGGQLCTPGNANVSTADCQTWNDCGGGSFGSNVTGPHGNGGMVDDTIWYNMGTGQQLEPNTTYYIVLDYDIVNPFITDRVVLDGFIQVGRRCKGRTWEYAPASITTNQYCTDRAGWRHYYDPKTPGTADDKYVFSLDPNGNNFEGSVSIVYNPLNTYYSAINGCVEATWVMRRYWNFNITSGSIAAAKPVKIRFYYLPAEKTEIINRMDLFSNTGCAGLDEGFEWFKSHDGVAFNPAVHIDPEYVIARYGSGVSTNAAQSLTVVDNQLSCNNINYVEYQNLLSFSGGTGATGNGDDDSPLPIELVSFTGYHNADKYTNNLNWVTATEINSSRFVVEKSLDGASFEYLGEKAGAGNSTTTLNYDFVDTKPALGDNYYRLKMVDKDGTFEYSKIININVGVGTAGSQILGIYPNPTHGMLNIRFLSGEKERFTMRVMNSTGQVVRENTFDFAAGINFIEMNTFDFADGLYILQFVGEKSGSFDGKFVKE